MSRRRKTTIGQNDGVVQQYYNPHLGMPNNISQWNEQQIIQLMLGRMLFELSMNRFKWEGLPEEINIRWMEMALATRALAVFYFDKRYDRHFALPGSPKGVMNMVGDPLEYIVWGNPFGTRDMDAQDVVPIWANYTRMPDMDIIHIYAKRLAMMDRTIEINALQARRSKILSVNENGRLTAKIINAAIESGDAAIATSEGIDLANMIQALDLGIDPQKIVNMDILRGRQWNQALTMLGINNANQDKKERLVAAEVSGNDDAVAAIRATNLQSREQACEKINKKFGLDVSVSYVTEDMQGDVNTPELKDTKTPQAVTAGGDK